MQFGEEIYDRILPINKKPNRQQRFCEIANYVVHSHLYFARTLVVTENTRLRSSQPRKAAKRYRILYQNCTLKKNSTEKWNT